MTTDNFCFYLQNRLIQTRQTGGQQYSDTCPCSIAWPNYDFAELIIRLRFFKPNHNILVEHPLAGKACQKNDISIVPIWLEKCILRIPSQKFLAFNKITNNTEPIPCIAILIPPNTLSMLIQYQTWYLGPLMIPVNVKQYQLKVILIWNES